MGGPQGRAGLDRCGKSLLPPRFDPRTVQPVASRYTDWTRKAIQRSGVGLSVRRSTARPDWLNSSPARRLLWSEGSGIREGNTRRVPTFRNQPTYDLVGTFTLPSAYFCQARELACISGLHRTCLLDWPRRTGFGRGYKESNQYINMEIKIAMRYHCFINREIPEVI